MLLHRSILALRRLASDDPARPALNALHVMPDGSAEATDGHVLLRVTPAPAPDAADWPVASGAPGPVTPPADGFLLPASAAGDALKALPKKVTIPFLRDYLALVSLNGTGALVATDLDTTKRVDWRPVDGQFPNVAQVQPKADPKAFRIAFNPALLKRLCETVIEASGTKGEFLTLVFQLPDSPLGAVRVECACSDVAMEGAIMPLWMPE